MSSNYYDDCAICRAMEKAEEQGKSLSEAELRAAFEAQRKSVLAFLVPGKI